MCSIAKKKHHENVLLEWDCCQTIQSLCMHPHLELDEAVEKSGVLNPGILTTKSIHFLPEGAEL